VQHKEIVQVIQQAAREGATNLELSGQALTELPPEVVQLTNLQELWLDGNRLTELPPEIVQLTNLQTLRLNDNRLTELSPEIVQLTNLQTLFLSNNRLAELPPEVGQLTNLQTLSLKDNRLAELPPEILELTNLQEFSLSNNQLTGLPPGIGRLTNLQTLSLDNNLLTGMPPEIGQVTNLQSLSLDNNLLTELPPEIGQLTNLQTLFLSNNQLTELPPEIVQLTNLQTLFLSNNQLTELPPEIGQLTNLQTLWLDNNRLTELPPEIVQLTNLQTLHLRNNQLTELPPEIGQLTNLQTLWLDNNQLTELPPEIVQLTNLQLFHLGNNPLRTPPPEIAARGWEDVRDFLRDLIAGSVTRYEAKLLLVGEGGTGKTSLLRALQGDPFIEGLSTTHGIDTKLYCLLHPDKPGEYITLNVWDFGGQQIYHTTHQFFMTKRSLYLLVWNARLDTDQARLDHWLRNIQILAPEAPILLVATHIDERPADFNYNRFETAYPQLVGHIGVSNKTGVGIEELKEIIAREAVKLPLMEQQWPATWCKAEEALNAHSAYHLSQADYIEVCVQQGVKAEIAQTALGGYLHDLGKILYYQEDDVLCDFVVLKPNWLTEAISLVLDDKIVRTNGGLLAHEDFSRIWGNYDRALYPRFLRLMEKFLISYKLPADAPGQEATHSLVPLRLPHSVPQDMPHWSDILPDKPEINMVFQLQGFTPPGLMSWFIVLTHPYTQGIHWRDGVRLQYDGHQAEAILNPSTHELCLRVRGPSPYNFFSILHHTINDRILGFYEGLAYKRLVPCNCHLGQEEEDIPCPYYHDYERLVERMQHNKLTAECDESFQEVSVPVLLYGIHYSTNDQVAAKLDEIHSAIEQGHEEITDRLVELSQGFELLRREFTRLWNYEMASIDAECPNTFILVPSWEKPSNLEELLGSKYTLHLMCQHPSEPHVVREEKGYTVIQSYEWWAKLTPWLEKMMRYLRYIPKVGVISEFYDDQVAKDIQASLKVFETILDSIPEKSGAHDKPERMQGAKGHIKEIEATGPALRLLHSFLKEADPEEDWCSLHKTVTRDGNILWLCEKHRAIHRI